MPDTPERRPSGVAPPARPTEPMLKPSDLGTAQTATSSQVSGARRSETAQEVKARAGEWKNEAMKRGRGMLDEQKGNAASQLSKLASVLQETAQQCSQREDQRGVGKMLQQAAGGLDRAADAIRSKDIDALFSQTSSLMRRQPAMFIGGAVAAGFLLSRFLKSSPERAAGGDYGMGGGYPIGSRDYGSEHDYDESLYEEPLDVGAGSAEAGPEPVSGVGTSYVTSAHANPNEVKPTTPTGRRDI